MILWAFDMENLDLTLEPTYLPIFKKTGYLELSLHPDLGFNDISMFIIYLVGDTFDLKMYGIPHVCGQSQPLVC